MLLILFIVSIVFFFVGRALAKSYPRRHPRPVSATVSAIAEVGPPPMASETRTVVERH